MEIQTQETQITKAQSSGIQCLQKLIKHLEANNRIDYALEVRNNYFVDNSPNYEAVIYKGLPMDYVCKTIDKAKIIKFIGLAISRCVKSFNVSKNMNDDQVIDMAVDWVESYSIRGSFDEPTIRIEELITFLELAKTGRYGQPFDRIDSSVIQEWFEKYYLERKQAHYDKLDSNTFNPDQKQLTDSDMMASSIYRLAGRMAAFKDANND